MSTLKVFSEKERAYHSYQARQNYLREQRSIQRHMDALNAEIKEMELAKEREQEVMEREREATAREREAKEREREAKEREREAKEREREAKEQERAAKEEALAEIERLKRLLGDKRDS